jgi:two-component system heavy metal sensor histidine kinase CusS
VKSISSRLTFWYAVTATATLAVLFLVGYFMLQKQLISQLDLLNEQQFKQLKATLGPNYATLSPPTIDARIRETTESASSLFFIDMHGPMTNVFFKSSNLHGQTIPDIAGERAFAVDVPGVGMVRASEFVLKPFDVMVATPLAPVYDVLDQYRKIALALLVLMLLISVALGFGLSQLMLAPVRAIRTTARRIGSDNLRERIPVGEARDEISGLAMLLNQMFDRLETSFDQIRRFAADASHELKTPLSLVRLHAERLLVTGNLEPAQRESLHVQLEELARVNQIIEELLFLSRADAQAITIEFKEQEPAGFLHSFSQDAVALAEHHGRSLNCVHVGDGTAQFEEKRMRQVLLNVVVNAINATRAGGHILVRSDLVDGLWRIAVEDDGPGLTPEQRRRMFERFVRFNPASGSDKGSGLGLAICRSIVQLHKGRIYAAERDGVQGLRMVIEIPADAARPPAAAPASREEPTQHAAA